VDGLTLPTIDLACGVFSAYAARMPRIFERDGYRFFFYSNEHRPIHVHVRYGSGEAVFDMEQGVELRESQGLKVRELTKAEGLATEHRELIIERWHEHFNR
jgi:hypothetical protein